MAAHRRGWTSWSRSGREQAAHFCLAPAVGRLNDGGRFDELIMYDGDLVMVAEVKMPAT